MIPVAVAVLPVLSRITKIRISMSISGVVDVATRNSLLHFGGDPHHDLDPGICKRILSRAVYAQYRVPF